MDGGVRSPLNADLARGHDRVLVVSVTVLPGRSELAGPDGPGPGPDGPEPDGNALTAGIVDEIAVLRSSGALVEVIEPNGEFLEVSGWGTSLMDLGKAGQAYAVGVRQGLQESDRVADLWGAGVARGGHEH
jgi:NTE family protein